MIGLRLPMQLCLTALMAVTTGCNTVTLPANGVEQVKDFCGTPEVNSGLLDTQTEDTGIPDFIDNVDMEPIRENALEIFKQAYSLTDNTLVSPLSIQCALALLLDASEGDVKQELIDFYNNEDIESCINNLLANQSNDKDNLYKISNTVWINSGNSANGSVREDYAKAIKEKYKSSIHCSNISSSVNPVNNWVEENTLGLINKILEEPVSKDTNSLLINAVGFDCKWASPFKAEDTEKKDFTLPDSQKVKVDTMYNYGDHSYIETENAYGARLDYGTYTDGKADYSLVVLMAKPDSSLQKVVENMTSDAIVEYITQENDNIEVKLNMPKFNFEQTIQLNDILQDLGVTKAFGDNDDIRILDNTTSKIDKAIQKTKIEVSEEGTKAGAVTALVMQDCAVDVQQKTIKEVNVDHSFVYMITDNKNQVPIFMGTIVDPTKVQ
jgi:serpin B